MSERTYWWLMVGWWLLTFAAVAGTSGSATAGFLAVACACYAPVLGAGFSEAPPRDQQATLDAGGPQ